MYVRAVRFTGVTKDRVDRVIDEVTASDGPPPGIPATGLKLMFDAAQGTAVVLQYFNTAEDMEAGAKEFAAMDPSETPGTRVSVDMCELSLDLEA
jgi:hypothetical protein